MSRIFPKHPKVECMRTKEDIRKDTVETASHEVGHALVSLHYGAASSHIHILMAEGWSKSTFSNDDKCVHGKNVANRLNVSPMDIAAIGYAGLIAMHLYRDQFADLDAKTVWEMINNSPKDWSKEDLAHIGYVPPEKRREAFNRAYTIIENNIDSLHGYTNYIVDDFAKLDKERVKYILRSISFKPPIKKNCDPKQS